MSHAATNWAIQQCGLKPAAKIVLWHLCDRFNPDYGCFPSQARLAEECEISRATLNRHLDALEAAGLIRRLRMVDARTGQQRPTRYLLAFESGFGRPSPGGEGVASPPFDPPETEVPCPDLRHGPNGEFACADNALADDLPVSPCLNPGHGPVSQNGAIPCLRNGDSRVSNRDTNLVREPLSKPVKEEEERAQTRAEISEDFFEELLRALGHDPDADLPGWWQGWPPREHVRRWRDDLELDEDAILAVAQASRRDHPEPPDGPKALDRAMQRAAQRLKQTGATVTLNGSTTGSGRDEARRRKREDGPRASEDDVAAYYAELVNSDRFLAPSTISNTMRDAMLARGLVTPERLRARGGAMSYHRRSRLRAGAPPGAGRGRWVKRALGVQAALEWAFRVEKAQLDLPERPDPERGHGFGFGLEYVLLQRAALGCRIDGGQYKLGSYTHADADLIATTLAGLPNALGGKGMAIRVAELARAGMTPDWMPGAVPRCVPVEVKRNQHGERAATMVIGTERVLTRGKWRTVEVLACPVSFSPHPYQIDAARRAYEEWWRALSWVRAGLAAGGMLREIEVTTAMPREQPWEP